MVGRGGFVGIVVFALVGVRVGRGVAEGISVHVGRLVVVPMGRGVNVSVGV